MTSQKDFSRYSIITEKNPREIVLLRGRGCSWRKCTFCDYHKDFSRDEHANYELNHNVLKRITGEFHCLEVINSGSFVDLSEEILIEIRNICVQKGITVLHFECHWAHRESIQALKNFFNQANILVKIKIGIETFDYYFRESYLVKGIEEQNPKIIAEYFDEVCLLQGLPGQTKESMLEDITIALTYFDRVCINIMEENTTRIKPDLRVRECFMKNIYPLYKNDPRVDILIHNTDFGVGGTNTYE